MGILDSGATHFYIAPLSLHGPPNTSASQISVGIDTGHVESSPTTATLPIQHLAEDFPTTRYIIPSFTNTLVGVRPICDVDCTVLFTKKDVTVLSPGDKPILTGLREKNNCRDYGASLWNQLRSCYCTRLQKVTKQLSQRTVRMISQAWKHWWDTCMRHQGSQSSQLWLGKLKGGFWDMSSTSILKCVQVLPTRSGNNQRAHGPILSRGEINQEEYSPT